MVIYFFGVLVASTFWLISFLMDEETAKTDLISWSVIAAASILWPIAVPLSWVELLTKA